MAILNWSEDIIHVRLAAEPQMGDEIKTVTEIVRDRGECDVVIDFSNIDIVTSSSFSKLLKLRKLLADFEHRLFFCNVAPTVKDTIMTIGLDGIFQIVDDEYFAKGGLVFEISVPDDATNDEIRSVIVKLAEEVDSLHRAMGGHGLKLDKLDIFRNMAIGSGVKL